MRLSPPGDIPGRGADVRLHTEVYYGCFTGVPEGIPGERGMMLGCMCYGMGTRCTVHWWVLVRAGWGNGKL